MPYDIYDGALVFIAFDVHYLLIPSVTDLEEVQAVVFINLSNEGVLAPLWSTLFCRKAISSLRHVVICYRLQLELFNIVDGKV